MPILAVSVLYKIVPHAAQTLDGHISTSKASFFMILASLERGAKELSNEAKIVEKGAFHLELRSSKVCAAWRPIL